VRQAIDTKAINVSHSESLELVSKMLGAPDWNTLSALLQADRRNTLALSPICDTLIEGFSHFVTSMTAPIASGWSGCRVGLAPTGTRRLCTAHTQRRLRLFNWHRPHSFNDMVVNVLICFGQ
jgi:hypothetical protein